MEAEWEDTEGHMKEAWIFGPRCVHLRMHGSVHYNPLDLVGWIESMLGELSLGAGMVILFVDKDLCDGWEMEDIMMVVVVAKENP
jgi:hypothetical protein